MAGKSPASYAEDLYQRLKYERLPDDCPSDDPSGEQLLVSLNEITPATLSVAMVKQEPEDLAKQFPIKFNKSFDDLDYLLYFCLPLSEKFTATLVRHLNSPSSGTEICVSPSETEIPVIIATVIKALNLSFEDLVWLHSDYGEDVRNFLVNDSSEE